MKCFTGNLNPQVHKDHPHSIGIKPIVTNLYALVSGYDAVHKSDHLCETTWDEGFLKALPKQSQQAWTEHTLHRKSLVKRQVREQIQDYPLYKRQLNWASYQTSRVKISIKFFQGYSFRCRKFFRVHPFGRF